MQKNNIDVRNFDLIFVDTELTGLDLKHEIVEIGFLKVEKGTYKVLAEKCIKIKPARLADANPESLAISGYNEKDWADAVDLKTGLTDFLSYTDNCMLVGQNIGVDMMHIKNGLEQCGLKPNYFYKGIDTFTLAWNKLIENTEIKRFSLSELAPHFGVNAGTQHRALDDARTTYGVFLKLIGR